MTKNASTIMLLAQDNAKAKELKIALNEAWDSRDENAKQAEELVELVLVQSKNDKLSTARVLVVRCYALMRQGRYDKLLQTAYPALEVLKEFEDLLWITRITGLIAIAYHHGIGDISKALELFLKCLKYAQKLNIEDVSFVAHHNLARHYLVRSDLNKANDMFELSYQYAPETSIHNAFIHFNHAHCLAKQGKLGEAELKAIKAFQISQDQKMHRAYIHSCLVLAEIADLKNDFKAADSFWSRWDLCKEKKDRAG